jgi:hypothetical protein
MLLTVMFGIVPAIISYVRHEGWRSLFRFGPTDRELWEAEVEAFWGYPPTVVESPERVMIDGRSYLADDIYRMDHPYAETVNAEPSTWVPPRSQWDPEYLEYWDRQHPVEQ